MRSACAGAAVCRHTWQILRRPITRYQPWEDSTRIESVSELLTIYLIIILPRQLTRLTLCTFKKISVVFRGPHDRYEHRDSKDWRELPVVSVVPVRWPKLREGGTMYSFADERELAKTKLRAALAICAYNDIRSVVIGDFGLGSCRNPPRETAEMWREVFLWDPTLRGRIENVAFVFEDRSQSTVRLILEEAVKKSKGKGKGKTSGSSSSSTPSSCGGGPTDFDIFTHVFNPSEITRVLTQPDTRMGVHNLMS